MKFVNTGVEKIDAAALVTGKPVYTDDLAPENCLVVKVLRSPHAFAEIQTIDTKDACQTKGIELILTWQDVPDKRFTMAGQSYPEPSPYDRLILDRIVRYTGDPVAIVAGWDEKSVDKALKLIKVSYDLLEPILIPEDALDHDSIIHPETDYHVNLISVMMSNAIFAVPAGLKVAMWQLSFPAVMLLWIVFTTQKPTTRP